MDSNENIKKNEAEQKANQNDNSKDISNNNIILYSTKYNKNFEDEEEIKNNNEQIEEKKIIINRNYSGKFERCDSDYCTNSESQSIKCLIY